MRQGEFRLLLGAVEDYVPFFMLDPDDELLLNWPTGHGLRPDELLDTLDWLVRNGDIAVAAGGFGNDHGPAEIFTPTRRDLALGLRSGTRLSYGLTPAGGERWAQFANVRWERVVRMEEQMMPDDDDELLVDGYIPMAGEMLGADRLVLEQVFAAKNPSPIVAGTVTRDVVAPWQVFYWKGLPQAYRIQYRHLMLSHEPWLGGTEPPNLHDWYVDPWDIRHRSRRYDPEAD